MGPNEDDLNAYLFLLNPDKSRMAEDDNGLPGSTTGSRIVQEQLGSGTYVIEVTSLDGSQRGAFSLKIQVEKPIRHFGHQADHTVQYRILGNPGASFTEAISTAVSAWNNAVSTAHPNGPGVLFCKRPPSPPARSDPIYCPARSQDDRYTVTIEVVLTTNQGSACNRGLACVEGENTLAIQVDEGHMLNMRMFIENETQYTWENKTRDVLWTNDWGKHGDEDGMRDDSTFAISLYLPAVIMHEFGHAAGLDDLRYAEEYADYLMYYGIGNIERLFTAIPALDTRYLWQVYRNEHGSEPHSR